MSPLPTDDPAAAVSGYIPLHTLLDGKAEENPCATAFRFLADGESDERIRTYADLASNARTLAEQLIRAGAAGKPVLVLQPPGLEFIEALFACWHAGAIAVPAYPPLGKRHKTRLESLAADCDAGLAITSDARFSLNGIACINPDDQEEYESPEFPTVDPDAPCLIQYTSGSTAAPKGVMISHRNFRSHFASLDVYRNLSLKSAASWLPPYHDMGLVLKILYSLEAGIPLTFFAPEHFIQRPARWLRAISRYRAEFSGAPNFAFELCLRSIRDDELEGIDLSCWKAAPCGAERIRPETLERFTRRFAPHGFNPEAFLPGYGLAETTLIVTASPAGRTPAMSEHPLSGRLVSSGMPLPGVSLRIADVATEKNLAEREIGEIRVKADVVSAGYWNRPEETADVFGTGSDRELRTGDLGYLEDGHLYVTGRIKDLIIIDGANHAPEDIEAIVLSKFPEVTAAAAFATDLGMKEAVTIAIEAGRIEKSGHPPLCRSIRLAIAESLEVPLHAVLLVRSGTLPRTTSGKIMRSACAKGFSEGGLKVLFSDEIPDLPSAPADDATLEMVIGLIREITGRDGARPTDDPVSFGMTSMETTRLAALLESRHGLRTGVGELFKAPSFLSMARDLSNQPVSEPSLPAIPPPTDGNTDLLTHSQERMWFLHQLDPDSAAYHVFGCLEMKGPLDADALQSAVRSVICRHDILRSRHGIRGGQPEVIISSETINPIELRQAEGENAIGKLLRDFARKPFRLGEEAPIRLCLLATGDQRHILAVCAHHIVADGWSLQILAREIAQQYAVALGQPTASLPDSPSYIDYAACHRRWIDSGAVDTQIEYWKEKLAGHSGVLPLATDFPRNNNRSSEGGAIEVTIPEALRQQIARVARNHRCTPFMVHLAVFLVLLRRHGGGDDPVVAIPVANRNHSAAENLIGTLVNTLPFRLTFGADESFATLLERVRETSLGMLANQDAPFEKIIEAAGPGRSNDHSPLAQVMFDYQEIPIPEVWSGGLNCAPYIAHRGAVQFDLSLLVTLFNDRQQLVIEYKTGLFLEKTAEDFLQRYLATLEQICNEPMQHLTGITALTDGDREWLENLAKGPERPDFPRETTPALISRQVAAHPETIAFRTETAVVDYALLDSLSNNLAGHLAAAGVKPGDRITLLLERDITLPIALLAAWKAGAAYIPLDPANPAERLRLVVDDQAPVHILVSPILRDRLPADHPVILMEDAMLREFREPPAHVVSPADTAYIIYTSGSTGRPKGVIVSHGALANFLLSMAETPGFTEVDRLLAVTTISFDISALEIFLPLVKGGSFDLIPTETARDGRALLEKLTTSRATVMQATPATWRLLLDAGWQGSPDLKILCGGEALDLPLAAELSRKGCQLWNLYGPTETTVWSTLWRVPENPTCVRIGTPIANTGIHVLAADGTCVPPGVVGDLWISGDGLSDGYWKRPDLNAAAFVDSRYRTGDLARWCPDGTLECMGRSDSQVKIRGFRVELGEIEAALASHPQVHQAKVALRGPASGEKRLVGWITATPDFTQSKTADLRDFLSKTLPAYMLPSDIAVIDGFPLNASGKVDTSALPDPETPLSTLPPVTPTEIQLSAIWSDLLQRTPIQRDDDWFRIGGHSLLALRLFSRIHEDFGLSLPLSTILESPSLHALAARIDAHAPTPGPRDS